MLFTCNSNPIRKTSNVQRLLKDVYGGTISIELMLVGTVAFFGLFIGTASIRDGITSELSDLGGLTQDMNQSYTVFGSSATGSSTAGMGFADALDHCDDAEDTPGVADNCISYDLIPITPISDAELAVVFDFDSGDASDSSPNGQNNSGTTVGDPDFSGGTVTFDGDDAILIPNSSDINLGTHEERTIMFDFIADDVTTRQLLYEEGGGTRGLSIYIDNGSLYVGGWNIPASESNWAPSFISTSITAGTWFHAGLVLNGTATVQPNALTGFLNGSSFASTNGSQLWNHGGGVGIGQVNGNTRFHDSIGNGGPAFFSGSMDNFELYNRALTDAEVYSAAQ
ncbi:MAG: LamG-like jellyroll fold domain-containing protein [Mariniblastus sp.]